jgi:hypothetical protein
MDVLDLGKKCTDGGYFYDLLESWGVFGRMGNHFTEFVEEIIDNAGDGSSRIHISFTKRRRQTAKREQTSIGCGWNSDVENEGRLRFS